MFNSLKSTLLKANQAIGGTIKRGVNGIGSTVVDNLSVARNSFSNRFRNTGRRSVEYTRAAENAPFLQKAQRSGLPKYTQSDIAKSLKSRGTGRGAEYKRVSEPSRISGADLPQYSKLDIARSLSNRGSGTGAEYKKNDSDVPFI